MRAHLASSRLLIFILQRSRDLLIALTLVSFSLPAIASDSPARVRTYYITAEKTEWDYAPSGKDMHTGMPVPSPYGIQTKYPKVRYFEYTDETFRTRKPQPVWLGILGPVIRCVEGETVKVVFWNRADKAYSMHPHGLHYDKDNEGATHEHSVDHVMKGAFYGSNGKGAKVEPNQKFTYTWTVPADAAPGENEGGSKVWMYHSHVHSAEDVNEGLIGPLIVTSAKHAKADGTPDDVDKEFITLFMIFDESNDSMNENEKEGHLKHSINGFIFGNLRGLEMNEGDKVRWHLLGMGSEKDLHTPHWHGKLVRSNGTYTDVIELLPASMKTVEMLADNPGEWMFHCHVSDHMKAGMMASYFIRGKSLPAK